MPTLFFHGPKMDKEKKAQLAQTFTESASEVTGIPKQAFVVYFKENDLENVATGGTLLVDQKK